MRQKVAVLSSLLVGAKLLNVEVPFLFKYAIDFLNEQTGILTILAIQRQPLPRTLQLYSLAVSSFLNFPSFQIFHQ
jgi:hypothetical protein